MFAGTAKNKRLRGLGCTFIMQHRVFALVVPGYWRAQQLFSLMHQVLRMEAVLKVSLWNPKTIHGCFRLEYSDGHEMLYQMFLRSTGLGVGSTPSHSGARSIELPDRDEKNIPVRQTGEPTLNQWLRWRRSNVAL